MRSSDMPGGTREKLKILFVTSTLYFGGAQKVTYLLADALSERYDVTVAYCFDSGQRHGYSERCRLRKLPEYARDAKPLGKIGSIREQIKALKALKQELGIDVSLSLGNLSNCINALSKGNEIVICSERSNPKQSLGNLFPFTRYLFRKADHVVFQSEAIRNLYGDEIRTKSSILKNPLLIPEPAYDSREKKIVAMGRLVPQKNYPLLIRSFAAFRERFPEYVLHIYGEGNMENELRKLARDLDVTEEVIFEGNRRDVLERIRDAEMFVLSSDFEGLSNALLESMSMGIACISTKCEGSVDVIRDRENGLLTEKGDEKGLTEAMCELAGDPVLRKKLESRAMRDMKAFERDLVVRDWEEVILRCAASAAGGEER